MAVSRHAVGAQEGKDFGQRQGHLGGFHPAQAQNGAQMLRVEGIQAILELIFELGVG